MRRPRALRPLRLALLALGMFSLAPATEAQFSTGDLQGSWSIYTRFDDPVVNNPGWLRGSVNIDGAGNLTGGSLTPIGIPTESITGDSLAATPGGDVSGTLTTDGPGSNDLVDLHFDLAADLVVGTDTDPDGFVSLVTAVRRSGTFSEADFAGNWYLYTHWDERFDPHSPGWARAEVTVDAFGTVTNTLSVAESDGAPAPLTGLDLNITAAGLVTISVPPTLTDSNLQMTPDKQTIFGVINDVDEEGSAPNFLVGVKVGAVATTADLVGTWYHYAFADGAAANSPRWERSVFTLDASGNAIDGSKTDSNGGSAALSGGSVAVDGSGLVDGTLSYGALSTDIFVDAKLNDSADLFAGVASGAGAGDDRRILSIAVLPEPGAAGLMLGLSLGLAGLGRKPTRG